ncbi:(2Fe-2S)-binding protein [Paenibacillus sp. IB182496]|uniref:(2Fe-2S)-binding protein n=1 Tax=Paenibacillus sabuli TaxID=2772509 RepID=A0A927GRN8_9BACL|nr:2Fe-2S iron-sulfur cluster-binding protein [Paenibacillus sabuli]MBD2845175.1 (2Fe-2S)-binding protein [Paenibacillus sabuli]
MSVWIQFLPGGQKTAVRPGTTVLEAARRARIALPTRCGGKAGCLMCKVYDRGNSGLSAPSDKERAKLAGAAADLRLGCQAKIIGPSTVEVPEDPLKAAVRRQLERQREEWP